MIKVIVRQEGPSRMFVFVRMPTGTGRVASSRSQVRVSQRVVAVAIPKDSGRECALSILSQLVNALKGCG